MEQAIGLLDCDNFYTSCEKLFDRSLHNQPVVVLSNNDGCIVARSQEAKQLGVSMGTPFYKIETFLEASNAVVFSSNYELYGDISARVMEHLHFFTPEVEVYSIDEAFLGLSAIELSQTNKTFDFLGREIQEKIYQWTGIPVSIGIAETKVLAKIANRLAKKSEKAKGVLDLYKSPYQQLALEQTAVADVWGVGAASARKLKQNEIFTARELRDAPLRWIHKLLTVVGARIVTELRGIRALPLELNPPPKQSITCSRSFGNAVTSERELRQAVSFFLHRAAEKMRRHKLAANSVTVFISTARFHPDPASYANSATYNSAFFTDAMLELQEWAFASLRKIYREGFCYQKAGVILGGLAPADQLTARMFDENKWERFRRVQQAVDEINRRWGRDTVRLGINAREGRWQMKAFRRSPRYTTRVDELLTIS